MQCINNCIYWDVCYQNYPLLRFGMLDTIYFDMKTVDSENYYVMEMSDFKKWKVKMCM
jgi:hypothetical protein